MANWNALMSAPNAGQSFMQAFQGGRQQRMQEDALRQQVQMREQELEQKQQAAQLAARAAQGDSAALVGLWANDPDLAFKLDKRQADRAAEGYKFIANAAYDIAQRPEAEKPIVWDQYIDQLVSQGFTEFAQYRGKYDPIALNSLVAKADEMKQFMEYQQPKYVVDQGYGMQGFQFGKPIDGGQITPGAIVDDPRKGGAGGNVSGNFPR